ncbi:MAG: hypothetical protein MJ236_07220, partial [Clostridia bacterium]|nr:hypothetical protein [Clostridia bacterium]
FAFIWLALKKDKHFKHFTLSIFGWWICAPQLSQMGGNGYLIRTARTTNSYHWIMALILVVGYAIFITYQLFRKEENKKWFYELGRLNIIGIAIQFAWEFALLLGGIRPWVGAVSIQTLLINSFIETNLGMPIIFFIFTLVTNKWNDDLTKVQKQS